MQHGSSTHTCFFLSTPKYTNIALPSLYLLTWSVAYMYAPIKNTLCACDGLHQSVYQSKVYSLHHNALPTLQAIPLTHWGRVTHICVCKLAIIGSDNGLSPRRRQAIIWTNAGILLIGPLGTNFSEILIGIQTLSFKKMHLKMSSAKWRPFVSASMS